MRLVSWGGLGVVASLAILPVVVGIGCGSSSSSNNNGSGGGSTGTASTTGGMSGCHTSADCPGGYVCSGASTRSTQSDESDCLAQCTQACASQGSNVDQCNAGCAEVCQFAGAGGGFGLADAGIVIPGSGGNGGSVAGGGTGGGSDTTPTGICVAASGGSGGSPGAGGASGTGGGIDMGGTGGSAAQEISWAGTWTADVKHLSNCEFGGTAMQNKDQSYTVTMNIAGDGSSLSATLDGGFKLTGTGDATHMTLNGDFPFRNYKGEPGGTNNVNFPNTATIKITMIDSTKSVSGTIAGNWDGGGGFKCTAANGTIALSR